jgi:hypothetical protein
VVLLKAVLAGISIYQSSLLLAPSTMIQKINALFKRFLWEGGKQIRRKIHLISWGKVTKPISEGDHNLRDLNAQNLALGAKLLWNLVSGKSTWSKKAIWKKYFHGQRTKCLDWPAKMVKGSPIFNLCLKSMRLFKPNLTWKQSSESVSDFTKIFNRMYGKIPAEIKPSDACSQDHIF